MSSDDDDVDAPNTQPEPQRSGGDRGDMPASGAAGGGVPRGRSYLVTTGLYDRGKPPPASLSNAFGIDLGYDRTRISALLNGRAVLVHDMPSTVCLETIDRGESITVVVRGIREALRTSHSLDFGGRIFESLDLALELFSTIRERLSADYIAPNVVLAVPAFYCSSERERLAECARKTGLKVFGVMNDYMAAIHGFLKGTSRRGGNYYVVLVGAHTCTFAHVQADNSIIVARRAESYGGLAGDYIARDLTARLHVSLKWPCVDLANSDSSSDAWVKTTVLALDELAKQDACQITCPSSCSHTASIEKNLVVRLMSDSLGETMEFLGEFVARCKEPLSSIDRVLFVGTIFQSDLISRAVSVLFPGCMISVLNPRKAVSFGGAVRAGYLTKLLEEPVMHDILSEPIFMESAQGNELVVAADTPVPTTVRLQLEEGRPKPKVFQLRYARPDVYEPVYFSVDHNPDRASASLEVAVDSDGIVKSCRVSGQQNDVD